MVLPAPLGPTRPIFSPFWRAAEASMKRIWWPTCLLTLSRRIIGCLKGRRNRCGRCLGHLAIGGSGSKTRAAGKFRNLTVSSITITTMCHRLKSDHRHLPTRLEADLEIEKLQIVPSDIEARSISNCSARDSSDYLRTKQRRVTGPMRRQNQPLGIMLNNSSFAACSRIDRVCRRRTCRQCRVSAAVEFRLCVATTSVRCRHLA